MSAQVIALRSLDEAVRAIHGKFAEDIALGKKAYGARIAAGQMLIDLRKRIEAGEAGEGVEWWAWYASKFVRSRKDAEKVMRIAADDDPEQAWEQEKTEARERMAQVRDLGANVRSNDDEREEQDREPRDPVDYAFRLVKSMTREQQQRFVAKLKEHFKW